MTLDEIISELEFGDMLPERAADLLPIIAGKYGRAADNYIVANANYAKAFGKERENHKSDTATERYLDYQEVGLIKHQWKYQMRKAEMAMKGLNGFIYQKTAEAKSQM